MEKKLTPAQKQYIEIKNQYKDCILFFRMGDFYETFYEDAKICSKALDITLTSRDRNSPNPTPMAGVPYHSADKYINKLVDSGYKVAIAEQVGPVKAGQIVKREISSIITPGTFLDQKDIKNYNFIAGISFDGSYQLCFGDFSVGEYFTKTFPNIENLLKFLSKINPSEIVLDIDFPEKEEIQDYINTFFKSFISIFDIPADSNFLKNILGIQSLESYGKVFENGRKKSADLLFNYLKETQKTAIKNISKISFWGDEDKVMLDDISIKNLEIFHSSYENNKRYGLCNVLDNTRTPMGARLFNFMLTNPINNLNKLNQRLDHIGYYFENEDLAKKIHNILPSIGDIPRLISKILYKKNSPFSRNRLRNILTTIFGNEEIFIELSRLGLEKNVFDQTSDFYIKIDNALNDEITDETIDFIKDGFDAEIDEIRKIAYHSDELLLDYQKFLIQKTNISGIKIKYITNQGYFIELTNKDLNKIDSITDNNDEKLNFVRRQTLKGAERFSTKYLDELQIKIIEAKDSLKILEKNILESLKTELENINPILSDLIEKIAYLDIFTSYAILAKQKNFNKPLIKTKGELVIINGRHPVIENFLSETESFIPNDLQMDDESYVHIITGPNMGGKSTFLRQNAIIILLAHCGLRVSAGNAEIPLTDGIFARVGSGDVLVKNQSTFMTEMIEVSNILNNATNKSFVVLDELGRGTSTYDGLALAKAILINIAQEIKCKTLFATHYHELIKLEGKINGVENFSVSVYETDKQVVFLKKIAKGGADKSYGIDVAKIAGINKNIIDDAKRYLKELELGNNKRTGTIPLFEMNEVEGKYQNKYLKIKKTLESLDINYITPMDALMLLKALKDDVKDM